MRKESGTELIIPIVDTLPYSLLLLDDKANLLWYNAGAEKNFKNFFKIEIKVGDNFYELLTPHQKKIFQKRFKAALGGRNIYLESKITVQNITHWFAVEIKPVYAKEELLGVLVNSYDITKIKNAEQQNENASDILNAIKYSTNDSSALINADKEILWFNSLFEQGAKEVFSKTVAIGGHIDEFVVENTRDAFNKNFEKAKNGEYIELEREIDVSATEKKWFWVRYFPIYRQNGKILGVLFSVGDINKRKRNEERILDANKKISAILNSTTDSYLLVDEENYIISFNKTANTNSETISKTVLLEGVSVSETYIKQVDANYLANLKKAFSGKLISNEVEVKINDIHKWIQLRYFPVRNDDNNIYAVAITGADITELKLHLNNLVTERKLFNQGPIVAFKWTIFKENSITKFVSENVKDVLGYDADEILGKSFLDFLHPDDLKWMSANMVSIDGTYLTEAIDGEGFRNNAYRVLCKSGEYKWVSDYSFLATDNYDGKIVCGYLLDITQQKIISNELEQKNEELNAALDLANIQSKILDETTNIIVLTDKNGLTTWVNKAFLKCTGYTFEDVSGKKPGAILQGEKSDPETINLISNKLKREEKVKTEILNYKKNRETYWVELIIEPIYDEAGNLTAFLSIQNDITERKRIEDIITEQKEQFKKFSFITSHELRHEFAKIMLLLENKDLLLAEGSEVNLISEIEIAAQTMNVIISKMNEQLKIRDIRENKIKQISLSEVDEICLVDDDDIVCFINKKIISFALPGKRIAIFNSVDDIINHIKNTPADTKRFIFLDLNMPYKNGWQFLEEYKIFHSPSPVAILSSSIEISDQEKSKRYPAVVSFIIKPLTGDKLENLL